MKFKLKETTVQVREATLRVRELTHAERTQWVKESTEDRYRGPALLVSMGSVPPIPEEEVGAMPAEVVEKLTAAIMQLSGMTTEKQPDAGGAVPVPAVSGVGSAA